MYDFIFKPFSEMTDEDFAKVGFKSGLEIHQQLYTEKKLFCRCPAGCYSKKFDAEILRHMRPTLSEMGEYDGTALMEFKTKKDIIYHINRETVCTYEMDDTPPFEINETALDISLEIAMLYKCSMIDEIHIARKQYLDGSIPTGFQRTTIVSVNGKIPYKNRDIEIIQLSLEEDSCREVSDFGHTRVYLTDRLGMPLLETVTGPDMKTPYEVADVANILRKLVRTTGKVRTGAGAAREDVNVSVTGGTRIEIKGVPSIKRIPLLTYNEAMRQWNLLRLREELKSRGVTPDTFEAKTDDITKLLKKTKYMPVLNALAAGMKINCVTLRGFKGLLRWQTQTDTYFSREISDRVRVIACLTTLPNIIHSDSTGETLATSEWRNIKKVIGATDEDAYVIVWGSKTDSDMAAREIIIRAKEATIGIPSETRQALKDGTNGFERILPGADRMYPDTDLPPKKITQERLERIKLGVPDFYWDRENWYKELNIPEDVIPPLAISRYAALFKKLVNEWKINPVLASVALVQYPKRLRKKKLNTELLTAEIMEDIIKAFKDGKIYREGILIAMEQAIKNNGKFMDYFRPEIKKSDMKDFLNNSKKDLMKIKIFDKENEKLVLLGILMNKVRGKADSKEVISLINKKN
ncbi:MAG: Glu-tRNA(Gln) amidotransferase subunit GatE [Ignavibacteriae bacterium]|nr:Glu-tRNA(Gln) amidotransferase subunit GatE [Ignavibacteriota bacterium]